MSAGYRLLGRDAVSIDDCIADVRRAVEQFGRLAALRGLEAPHLASGWQLSRCSPRDCCGDDPGGVHHSTGALGIAAVVALNPAGLNLRSFEPEVQRRLEQQVGIAAGRLIEYSLIEFVRPGNPPMQIHHGTRDEVEPIDSVRQFRDAMVRSGNECTLLEYEHAEHGFHYPSNSRHFDDVIDATALFLLDRIAMK